MPYRNYHDTQITLCGQSIWCLVRIWISNVIDTLINEEKRIRRALSFLPQPGPLISSENMLEIVKQASIMCNIIVLCDHANARRESLALSFVLFHIQRTQKPVHSVSFVCALLSIRTQSRVYFACSMFAISVSNWLIQTMDVKINKNYS